MQKTNTNTSIYTDVTSMQFAMQCNVLIIRLHRMHEMQTIVTDVSVVCLSVCQMSVSLSAAAQLARLHCAVVILCSLCQITLASCFYSALNNMATSRSTGVSLPLPPKTNSYKIRSENETGNRKVFSSRQKAGWDRLG